MVDQPVICVFRCDSSAQIGSGHFRRCVSLAKTLKDYNARCIFITQDLQGSVYTTFSDEVEILLMDPLSELEDINYEIELEDDLQISDADKFIRLIRLTGISHVDWVIVDSYSLGESWQKRVSSAWPNCKPLICAINDFEDRRFFADIIINQNLFDYKSSKYRLLAKHQKTKMLLGPSYALIDEEFREVRRTQCSNSDVHRIQTVLVSFGGGNHDSLLGTLVPIFRSNEFENIDFHIAVSSESALEMPVEESTRTNVVIHKGLNSILPLMEMSDLGIGAIGGSTWERACLGIPSILIPVAENQSKAIKFIQKSGIAHIIEANVLNAQKTPFLLKECLSSIVNSKEQIGSMKKAGLRLCDGWGTSRVSFAMSGNSRHLRLREATISDLELYYTWVNDPLVRLTSFSSEPVDYNVHSEWFYSRIKSKECLMYVCMGPKNLPVGQVRFDRINTGFVRISYSLDVFARGMGLASTMLGLAMSRLYSTWDTQFTLIAELKSTNIASLKTLKSVGFREVGSISDSVKTLELVKIKRP